MNEDKWITVDPKSNKLAIRFRVKGFDKQFYIASRLKDTKRNREIVRLRRDAIMTDIALERFDPTLNSYQFKATKQADPAALVPEAWKTKYELDLQQLWEKYTEFQSSQLEKTTILVKYHAIANHISRLPTNCLEDAPKIRDWVLNHLTHYMAWEVLNCFSRCGEWACNSGIITDNPFFNLKIQKPKQKSTDDDRRAFTLEQRDLIIKTFDQHPLHAHYSPLVKFLFWTGCRPGEAFALTWSDISADCCRITINKSCNGHKILKGTKNGKKRVFPTQPGSKLQQMLLTFRLASYNPAGLVFLSKAGQPMSSRLMFSFWHEWESGSADKIHKYPGVVKSLANGELVPYLRPYAMRHTFATWAISSGISPDKVALWIGDTVETVLTYYCHPEIVSANCPDF